MPSSWDRGGDFTHMGPWHRALVWPKDYWQAPDTAIQKSSVWSKAKPTWREEFQSGFLKSTINALSSSSQAQSKSTVDTIEITSQKQHGFLTASARISDEANRNMLHFHAVW